MLEAGPYFAGLLTARERGLRSQGEVVAGRREGAEAAGRREGVVVAGLREGVQAPGKLKPNPTDILLVC